MHQSLLPGFESLSRQFAFHDFPATPDGWPRAPIYIPFAPPAPPRPFFARDPAPKGPLETLSSPFIFIRGSYLSKHNYQASRAPGVGGETSAGLARSIPDDREPVLSAGEDMLSGSRVEIKNLGRTLDLRNFEC